MGNVKAISSFNIKLQKGDVCKFESNNNGCITTSIGLILSSKNKKSVTYLCINDLLEEITNSRFITPIVKKDFESICDENLFVSYKFLHIIINQIKTTRVSSVKKLSGRLKDNIMEIVDYKLSDYLDLNPNALKEINNEFEMSSSEFDEDNIKFNKRIKLSKEARKDLIDNYTSSKKEYYSDRYRIPLDKISQKVASLRFQDKKRNK